MTKCPRCSVPMLPEGAALLACPQCQHTIVHKKPKDTEERRQRAATLGGYNKRKKAI